MASPPLLAPHAARQEGRGREGQRPKRPRGGVGGGARGAIPRFTVGTVLWPCGIQAGFRAVRSLEIPIRPCNYSTVL